MQLCSNTKGLCIDCKGAQELIMLERKTFTNVKKQVYPNIKGINLMVVRVNKFIEASNLVKLKIDKQELDKLIPQLLMQ